MAADAMIRLGGGDRVERWVENYRVQLAPAPQPGNLVTTENWRRNLGRIDRLGDWDSYFRRQLDRQPWQLVLATWWPRLLPGAAAGATHGLIRTAHAVRNLVESADPDPLLVDELGAGLSYWAARHQPLPGNPSLDGRLTLPEAMALATETSDGRPSVRDVLNPGESRGGFDFYTHYNSRKADDLAGNPPAASVCHWPKIERQFRVEGRVNKLTRRDSDHA